jgi:thioredoxin 2
VTTNVSTSRVITCPNCGQRNRTPSVAKGAPTCGRCHRPLPWIADAGDDTFGEVVDAATLPVLVDLWATWCGPCRMVSPALEQVATELAGRVKLVKVDVDAAPATSRRFQVQAVPTLLIIRDGTVLSRKSGAAPATALRAWVDDVVGRRS